MFSSEFKWKMGTKHKDHLTVSLLNWDAPIWGHGADLSAALGRLSHLLLGHTFLPARSPGLSPHSGCEDRVSTLGSSPHTLWACGASLRQGLGGNLPSSDEQGVSQPTDGVTVDSWVRRGLSFWPLASSGRMQLSHFQGRSG